MAITKSTLVVSKAGKAKNRKWASVERFSLGHDAASRSLIPESGRLAAGQSEPRQHIGSWRSDSVNKTRDERVYESAKRLLDAGRAASIDEAVERAEAALNASWGSKIEALK